MDDGDFYLTAPSNASLDVFPDNTLTSFKIRTVKPIDLAKYQVALTEIQYPYSWFNVRNASMQIKFPSSAVRDMEIADGKYESIEELVSTIQKSLQSAARVSDAITISWDKRKMKTIVNIRLDGYQLTFSPQLQRILGFKVPLLIKGLTISEYHTDINEGMTAIYIYSNIVRNQLVGDAMVPLLRVVPIRGTSDDVIRSEEFQHPRYLNTNKETTSVLEFYLRRDNGERVLFVFGKVILTLHFRRV